MGTLVLGRERADLNIDILILMKYLLILGVGVLLGYFIFSRKRKGNFISQQSEQKAENKRKILELLNSKHPITNNDVEDLLKISDASVTRYLDELEKEGKEVQVGRTGKHVNYEKV